jgi:hypothetical protein
VQQDAMFCLPCFLFAKETEVNQHFITVGVKNWKKVGGKGCILLQHQGGVNSAHSQNSESLRRLSDQNSSIEALIQRRSAQRISENATRLNASIEAIRYLTNQGLAFRGDDESQQSLNKGNFLQLLTLLCKHSQEFDKVCLDRAPQNAKMTSPDVQKDIVEAFACEVRQSIASQITGRFFALLADEARDVSTKEQMSLVVRFVDAQGYIQERFLDLVHVPDTRAESLRLAIISILDRNGLSLDYVRGQGYDGASNMRGELNGLKSLILQQNPSAHYVHCFAHRLQLALMSAAEINVHASRFFSDLSSVCNTVSASCRRADQLRESQAERIRDAIEQGTNESGRGLNQICSLRRPGETRWGSHFISLCRVIELFPSIVDVLENIAEDGTVPSTRADALNLIERICCFDFIFMLFLAKSILGISSQLSIALQRRDQDIINAMDLVNHTKTELNSIRSDAGWSSLLTSVSEFCSSNEINIPDMNTVYAACGRPRRNADPVTVLHHYRVDVFFSIVDSQIAEIDFRFPEQSSMLLRRIALLSPQMLSSLGLENIDELICLAKMYPSDFNENELYSLEQQIRMFIMDLQSNALLKSCRSLPELNIALVQLQKSVTYHLVHRLINLALVLPVSTASSERSFSAMTFVKNKLRNRLSDRFLSNLLVLFVEQEQANKVSNSSIVSRFSSMANRRCQFE